MIEINDLAQFPPDRARAFTDNGHLREGLRTDEGFESPEYPGHEGRDVDEVFFVL